MSGLVGHRGLLLRPNAGPPAGGLYGLIMAQGPVNYWRNAEPASSPAVMVDEVAASGSYSAGSMGLGRPALYPGGGTSLFSGAMSGAIGQSTSFPASLTSMTLFTIIRPTNLTGLKLLGVQRDQGGGGRKYQWRSNGAAMEFVKIVGGVTTISDIARLAINTTYVLSFEVNASGNYAMYVNGVSVKTGTIAGANYGGPGDSWRIGYAGGPAVFLEGNTCENAVFDKVLGPTIQAALFAATGL